MKHLLVTILYFITVVIAIGQPKKDEELISVSNINVCLLGDCINGAGKMLRSPTYDEYSMQIEGQFKNGSLNGDGQVIYFTKNKHDTLFRYVGQFLDGLLVYGNRYTYGHGITSGSIEKDEGIFENNFLSTGTVAFTGYGEMIDGSYKINKDQTEYFTGDCKNGNGQRLKIVMNYYSCTFLKQIGKFKDGNFISGNMVIDGYEAEPFKNGFYIISNWKLCNNGNGYSADVSFKPKGYFETIYGKWGKSDAINEYPFDISDSYLTKKTSVSLVFSKTIPVWIKEVYLPYIKTEDSLLSLNNLDMAKNTSNNKLLDTDRCYMCQGSGLINSGKFYMGRNIPMKCPCCHGYGKMNQQIKTAIGYNKMTN